MITIEVSPILATLLGFKQLSESSVEPEALLASADLLTKRQPALAKELCDSLLSQLGLRLISSAQ